MENPTQFHDFIVWGFYSLLTGILAYAVYTVRDDFRETTRSLQILAINVAQLTERLGSFEKSLDRLDERLEKLEDHSKN
jgi:hypothetical protein